MLASFGGAGASALSVQAAAERLLAEESWSARLALLASEPRLVDGSVARWCAERGEGLLGAVIVRAGEVGVQAVGVEVPSALALVRAGNDDTTESSESIRVVREALALVAGGATWLWPLVVQVVEVLVARIRGHAGVAPVGEEGLTQLAELRGAVEPLLVSSAGVRFGGCCTGVDVGAGGPGEGVGCFAR